jgi:hypothetical protein
VNKTLAAVSMTALAVIGVAASPATPSATVSTANTRLVAVVPHDPPVRARGGPGQEEPDQVSPVQPRATQAGPTHTTTGLALQAGVTALAGAGIGCGAMWIHRRRQGLNS